MITKKGLMFLFCIILLSSLVIAQQYKIEISTTKETFKAKENITFIVTLYDSDNNPIYDQTQVVIEYQDIKIEKTVQSNQPEDISPTNNAPAGEWKITATYKDSKSTTSFFIKSEEKLDFNIENDILTITNVGNTKYTKTIEIVIGNTPGTKKLNLDVGEKISLTLVAPEGNYNIKVIVDGETSFSKNNVELTGRGFTGQAVGILDEQVSKRSPVTGGISPDESSDQAILNYLRDSKFIYVFVLVIFGATILLAIERRYKKKQTDKT